MQMQVRQYIIYERENAFCNVDILYSFLTISKCFYLNGTPPGEQAYIILLVQIAEAHE